MLRVVEEFHATHTGRQRRENEDSLFSRSPLFGVADGMGGAQAGEVASRIAVETLAGGVRETSEPAETRLAELVHEANERIHSLSVADDRRAGMGTTMTVGLVGEDDVTIAHVGDSRLYLWRDEQLRRVTRDHSLVEELVEQGRLTPEEASTHPQRSVITRSVGPEPRVQVDTQTLGARDGDVFLICSDGLTTMIDEPHVAEILGRTATLEDAGHQLIDAANDAGGRDNITVVLFRLADVHGASRPEEQATGVHEAVDTADADTQTGPVATMAPPRTTSQRRLEPLGPDRAADAPGPRKPWVKRLVVTACVLAFVVLPISLAGFAALRAVYFVGTNDDGFVTVYRGLPYELPLGIDLYQENYVSPITRDLVPSGRRTVVTDQELRSQKDAYDLVRQLELGQLQGTR